MSLEQKNDWEQETDIKSLELEELTEQLSRWVCQNFAAGRSIPGFMKNGWTALSR